ncbi:Uncharacterised protein [Pseudomonas aeruginosa]|nr:Uncharacterised protein [Pseudomonas aeruginosa]
MDSCGTLCQREHTALGWSGWPSHFWGVERRSISHHDQAPKDVHHSHAVRLEQLLSVGQVLADEGVELRAIHHLCDELAGVVAEQRVAIVDRNVVHPLGAGHIDSGSGALVANGGDQGGNGCVQLILQKRLGEVTRSDFDAFSSRLAQPGHLGWLVSNRAKAASYLDGIVLQLGQIDRSYRVIRAIAVHATTCPCQTCIETGLQEVSIESVSGQKDRSTGRCIEPFNHLGQRLDGSRHEIGVEHLHIGKCHGISSLGVPGWAGFSEVSGLPPWSAVPHPG